MLRGAAVAGAGSALPQRVLDNASLARSLGIDEAWIFERTGILERRVAGKDETLVDLAAAAGRSALADAGVEEADAVIVATFTPDERLPGAAPQVASRLGLDRAAAFDLNAGCAGFLYALTQATALVETGAARRVLVVGADIMSRVTDYADRRSCVLFGDGAGAFLVQESRSPRLGPFRLYSDGSRPRLLWMPPETQKIAMNGREVYRRAVDAMSESIRDIARRAGMTLDDIDLVVAHQANVRILRAVAARLELPFDRLITNIAEVGNTSAASIPLAVDDARRRGTLRDGDVIALTAFGAGFAWGAGMMTWGTGSVAAPRRPQEEALGV